MWNKDEVKGKAERAKGAVKEKTGELLGDSDMEKDGKVDQAKGTARESMGNAKRVTKETADDATKLRNRK